MATRFYLTAVASSVDPSNPLAVRVLSPSPGADAAPLYTATTVLGPTTGVQLKSAGTSLIWVTEPLDAVTISGTITANVWGLESSMNANAGFEVKVHRCSSLDGGKLALIADVEFGTELGTAAGVQNWTLAPTSTAIGSQERLGIEVFTNDAGGTMASGFTITLDADGSTGGVDGDTWVEFTEAVTIFGAAAATRPPYKNRMPPFIAQ